MVLSVFGEVLVITGGHKFEIKGEIKSEVVSPETNYASYLVYKLPQDQSTFEVPMFVWEKDGYRFNGWYIFLVSPPVTPVIGSKLDENSYNTLNRYKGNAIPQQRSDGWMEVKVWQFNTKKTPETVYLHLKLKHSVIQPYFINKYKGAFNIALGLNVYSNARACIRLRASCEKLKKVLSANTEAPLSIECLIEDKDVRGIHNEGRIQDVFPYSIVFPADEGGDKPLREFTFFSKGCHLPSNYELKYNGRTPFHIDVFYTNTTDLPAGLSSKVGHLVTATLKFQLNTNGIFELKSVQHKPFEGKNPRHMPNLLFTRNLDVATTKDEFSEAQEREKMLAEQDTLQEKVDLVTTRMWLLTVDIWSLSWFSDHIRAVTKSRSQKV
ncbi:kinase-like domain, phloem protein 2-like protein [Tanacetum coccineum]